MKLSLQLFSRLPGLAPLFLVASSFAVRAELPPAVYDQMKREAPEVFLVRIEEAAKNKIVVRGKQQQFTYEAKVLRVFRTRSRIRAGRAIVIQSQHHIFWPRRGWAQQSPQTQEERHRPGILGQGRKGG